MIRLGYKLREEGNREVSEEELGEIKGIIGFKKKGKEQKNEKEDEYVVLLVDESGIMYCMGDYTEEALGKDFG